MLHSIMSLSSATDDYIKQFKLHPIILVRNIFDVVPYKNHLRSNSNISPMAQIPKDH